jgi:hypothetical protein
MAEIVNCPLCGGAATVGGLVPWVECQSCGASGPQKTTEAEAIAAWNARHDHSPDAGKVGEDAARYRWIVRRPKSKITIDSQWGEQRISFTTTDADSFIDSAREQAARAGERG